MGREEIISTVLTYLDEHLKEERGYIGQSFYKDDFFKLFKEAYKQGYFDPSSGSPLLTRRLSENREPTAETPFRPVSSIILVK